jgi:hypothetical protein
MRNFLEKFFCNPYFLDRLSHKVNPLKKNVKIFWKNFFAIPTFKELPFLELTLLKKSFFPGKIFVSNWPPPFRV